MAAEEEADALKLYWDHFFRAETGTYEKSTWLDLFLAEFLIRLNKGENPKDLINFCPVSGVVTLVGCELLCGIHRVTSSVTALAQPLPQLAHLAHALHAPQDVVEDSAAEESGARPASLFSRANAASSAEVLRQYLLGGVAWRCLALLKALGVEGLSCCRQLSSVLVWLFGELSAAPRPPAPPLSPPPVPPAPPRPPIHHLFSTRIWSKQKAGGQSSKGNSAASSERGSVAGRSRYNGQGKADGERARKWSPADSEQSTDSVDSDDDLQLLNRSMTIKVSSPHDDFEYFNSPLRSSTEFGDTLYGDPYCTPRKPKPKPDDYLTDRHRQIINSEITTFQFTLIITDLLQELCRAESSLSGSEGSQISMQCINFALKNLCTLQFGSLPAQSLVYEALELSRIKVALTELLIVSLDQVLVHSDLCAKLINNGILPMLLRILEDVICKSSAKYNTKTESRARARDETKPDENESQNLLKFVFGIAYSITAFFHCLLMQCRSVDKLREFTDQFKLYGECLKGGLFRECMELMIRIPGVDKDESVLLIKKLIECTGKLISGMKRVRSEVLHSAACPRGRHKACRQRVAAGMHHHHDVLGEATGPPLPSACCVAVLYGTLAALLPDEEVSAQKVLRNKILRVMLKCGVCCCFSPSVLMESIVRLVLTHSGVSALCLQLLEHTVYGDLGASILAPRVTDQLPCSICEPCEDARDVSRRYCSHPVGVERQSVWSFLIHYNSLLQLENHNDVLHATVGHLLKVTPRCRTEMKYELLFSVIYPTFIVSKHRYTIKLEEAAYFLTVSCLNIFASLLNTVSFAEQFIQKGGLSYVLELLSLPEFSNECCAILEIAVTVEIFKLKKENAELSYRREVGSLASVRMLFKSLDEVTAKFFKIMKAKLPDEFEELCDVEREREMLQFENGTQHLSPAKITEEDSNSDDVDVLKNALTFWQSCARLCVQSATFLAHAARQAGFVRSYALLKLALRRLCGGRAAPPEARALVKLMEALLTVQFAAAEVTGQRSAATSCGVVRAALGARAAGGGLRALCDALVAVAVAPARRRAAPAIKPPKVPPLQCAAGGSSGEWSSSEESAAGPYASEHSEPRAPPDDGYEADVEVGRLERAPCRPRNMSEAMTVYTSVTGGVKELAAWDGAQPPRAHPELCVIVVDILTQLIDRLVSEEPSEGPETRAELERVCVSLARACAARLAGGAAPPLLLARLLARAAPAARLLTRDDNHLAELQRAILELVVGVGSARLAARELAALLRLFAAGRPPRAALLHALRRLLPPAPAARAPPVPDYCLRMPLATPEENNESNMNGIAVNHLDEPNARLQWNMHRGPECARVVACASARAESAGWAPWLQGFALLLWLRAVPPHAAHQETGEWQEQGAEAVRASARAAPRPHHPPRAHRPLHVLSLGTDSLMFELWMHPDSGILTVRLTRAEGAGSKVVSEATSEVRAGPRWSCVALNVCERVHKRRIHIQVTVFINGRECETLSLPLQGILVRKAAPLGVLVGHAGARGEGGGYEVSTVRVYRAPALSAPAALHLAAHGADQSCHIRCESPNFPSIITSELLDMDIDWDQVFELPSSTVRELQEALLLELAPHAPHQLVLHPPPGPLPTVFGGRAPAGGGLPEILPLRWAGGTPTPTHHAALPPALLDLGGPDLLLYLFARIIELDGSAEEQALALGVLMRACGADARLHAQLHADTLELALPLLASDKCRVSHHLLKVILDEAYSAPVLVSGGGAPCLLADTRCAVLEPRLLLLLMRAWRQFDDGEEIQWEVISESESGEEGVAGAAGARGVARGSVWVLALAALHAALRPAHPRRAFNQLQAARVDLLRHLLLACKERFLNSENPPLSVEASRTLVELVRALLGAPPLPCHLALLCDFLLLMHQASDTFVTHSRANFYFLLTPDTPEASEFNLLALLGSRRRGRDKRRAREEAEPPASDAEPERTDDDSGDSAKHMKGLINMQIKESRNHASNNSLYSDVSTANTESSSLNNEDGAEVAPGVEEADGAAVEETRGAGEGEAGGATKSEVGGESASAEDVLTEYIVVDAEDVSHTTVNVYTSGLYHQRRVRAGAAPGWSACEGLLLLLQDSILALPDSMLAQAASGAVQAEVLVVLANHKAAGVRAAVVRAIAALQARAPQLLATALGAHFYVHLADQICLYPASWELVAACAALLTKCDVPLEDQLDEDIWMDAGEEAATRAPPLLALLPACLPDVPLAHNVLAILRRLVDKSSTKALTDIAFVEVVVRSVREAGRLPERAEGRALLLDGLADLLARAALPPAVAALTPAHSQMIMDIHNMLSYVEASESGAGGGGGGGGGGAARAACEAQVTFFTAQLDWLERRLHDTYAAHTKQTGYFTNVLSVAMEGGLLAGRTERAELGARHAATLARAAAFLLARSPRGDLAPLADFFERVFDTLLIGMCGAGVAGGERGKWWAVGSAECAGPLHELFWWALAPAAGARALQPRLLRALYRAPPDLLRHLTPRDPPANRKLSVYLTCAVQAAHSTAARGGEALELCVTDWAREWAVRAQAPLADRLPPAALPAEAARLLAADRRRQRAAHARHRAALAKSVCLPVLELCVTDWAREWAVRAQAPLADRLPPAALPAEAARLLAADRRRQRAAHARHRAALAKSVCLPVLELCVTDWAREWAVRAQAPLADRLPPAALPAEAARLLAADRRRQRAAHARHRAALAKSVFSREGMAARACAAAMGATRRVVEAQNGERKAFLDHMRASLARAAAAAQRALRRLTAHTHERAVWYSPRGQPAAWALDSTEGPGRVRVRLRRAHLRIPPRLLQPKYRYKAEAAQEAGPLRSVLGGSGLRGGVAARLQPSETVAYMARVTHVTVARETPGELLLTDRCIHFVPEESSEEAEAEEAALCFSLAALQRAATRRWCLQERALELFLRCGRAHLLAFAARAERQAFLDRLACHHSPDRSEADTLSEATAQWRAGALTNWEYLMTLNGLAGRSYNDLMQYPVLPFVLADYTSRILDLTVPDTFRDLAKPMAVQNKDREQHYINTYNDLRVARREGCSPLLSRQPHHYASLYSNSGGVLHYLVRVPPFTELFLNYQDNNFDMPDRTFHSLATTWRLITRDSPTDVKELIPELFYLPEMFCNNEGLELGVRQCGARVDSVQLPRWAADARLFTLLHRQALEAPLVADRLPLWIDLVFGCKQTGQAAIDAINVFPACTYYGFDPTALEDEVDRTAAAAMVRTYGQAPRQLLRTPHPQRAPDLRHYAPESAPVWDGVRGARWGRYCGSPALPPPAAAARRARAAPATLLALPPARAAALCALHSALIHIHDESITASATKAGGAGGAGEAYGVLSWGHADGALRLRRRRDLPPDLLLHVPPRHQITAVGTWTAGGARRWGAFLGHESGRVTALRARVPAAGAHARAHVRLLHAHAARVSDVVVCARASLLVTASEDGVIVVWDLNELSYIRTLPNRGALPVRLVAVSETLSDVASVHALAPAAAAAAAPAADPAPPRADADDADDSYEKDAALKHESLIRVHTVNARYVGSVKVLELVTAVCYSNAAEGVSVNCVAAGLACGGVRLYSCWDLRPVALVPRPARAPPAAVISLTYSSDSSLLFASYADGAAVAWESAEAGARAAPLRMLPAHALL